MAQPGTGDEFITLARVIKTQGRVGEVAVELHSDVPDRLTPGMRVLALTVEGTRRELKIAEVWPHQNRLIVKFDGMNSISEAEPLLGCELQVPISERAALEAGSIYISDLVGCMVLDGEREIGEIKDVRFGAGEAPLLIVSPKENGTKEYEIPFAEAYLQKVDLSTRQVRMRLPEGMLEVNAPLTPQEKREQQKKNSR